MQRNMDLVRTILMRIEDSPSGWAVHPFGIAGYIPEQVEYHAHIMMEDGLIEAVDVSHLKRQGLKAEPRAALTSCWKYGGMTELVKRSCLARQSCHISAAGNLLTISWNFRQTESVSGINRRCGYETSRGCAWLPVAF